MAIGVMYKVSIKFVVICAMFKQAQTERCTTPNGEAGECIPLTSCPALLWAFTNPKIENEGHLANFTCGDSGDTEERGRVVCCRVALDILTFQDDASKSNVAGNITTKLRNLRHCGLQRKDKYDSGQGPISVDEFPWLVGIMATITNSSEDEGENEGEDIVKTACTGSLINARYVLTGAQCFYENIDYLGSYFVRIEEFYDRNTTDCLKSSPFYVWNCSHYIRYDVDKQILHPFYDQRTHLNDIALLRLTQFVPFSDHLRPICLPLPGVRTAKPGDSLYTSGWSSTPINGLWATKSKALVTLMSNEECKGRFRQENISESITPYEMCTTKGKTAIQITCGDNIGNPIMAHNNNRWHLEAIWSWGGNCTNKIPAVSTNVHNYLQWIQENMQDERCITPDGEEGKCISLSNCPVLLKAFANPEDSMVEYLNRFVCSHDKEVEMFHSYTLIVCCGTSPNFKVLGSTNSTTERTEDSYASIDLDNSEYCGFQHRDDYFSEDDTIAIDEFPWLAALYLSEPGGNQSGEIVCGGTLINSRYVLSAAQCLENEDEKSIIIVRLGEYNVDNTTDCVDLPDFNTKDCSVVKEFGIEERIVHPFFNSYTYLNDLALLRLNRTVVYSDYIRPICLPISSSISIKPGETLYTTGFGEIATDESQSTRIKKKIATSLITNEKCLEVYKFLYPIFPITPYQLCTWDFRNGTEFICEGDIGSPIMYSTSKHQWFIEGISSGVSCADDEPQGHIKVSKYMDWIVAHIRP